MSYRDAGVDIEEGARAVEAIRQAVRKTYTPEVIGDIGGFGALYSAAALKSLADPVLVSGTDGVGTKLALAKRLGRHQTVGIDLVAMCANDIVTCGARPLFFLDYLAIAKLEAPFAAEVVGGIAEGCVQAGCALIGGEMAEHPGVMAPGDYDLSGFCVGVVDRPRMIGPHLVREKDVLLGLASSGLHSNGYSLVRHAYTDTLSVEELVSACLPAPDGRRIADALLAPTRVYVQQLLSLIDLLNPQASGTMRLHAAAHITGGGITENLNRVLPPGLDALVDLGAWPLPPLFALMAQAARLTQAELLRTLNCGIGLVLVVDPAAAAAALEALGPEQAWVIGEVVPAAPSAVSVPTMPPASSVAPACAGVVRYQGTLAFD
ncbi:MAG: phosphoribosylformylglycinamidine cyclo-ligase [Coriobacteriales bacterium]|jgi:phosphoribosylformylglycinamidine cyclo-ligase|nr:phosphoribosylformylglycinamidine cyclo-ligase [Coriobacteriales bacterium]